MTKQASNMKSSSPSVFSGSAAIRLPSTPRPAINLPTSAARSVLNLSTTPEAVSYVFKVIVARGVRSSSAFSADSLLFEAGLVYRGVLRFGMLYLVVMRA